MIFISLRFFGTIAERDLRKQNPYENFVWILFPETQFEKSESTLMVVVTMLPHAEFDERDDQREEAPHFTYF